MNDYLPVISFIILECDGGFFFFVAVVVALVLLFSINNPIFSGLITKPTYAWTRH